MKFGQPFLVDAKALLLARASQVLAIHPDFIGSMISLPESIAETQVVSALDGAFLHAARGAARTSAEDVPDSSQVAIVSIDGALAQRGQAQMCGMIDGYDWIAGRVIEAANDPKVGALVLRINSPGGDVAGLEEAVKRMRAAVEKQGKYVEAFADEQAASAAFRIASGVADYITVPRDGELGSVGSIGGWIDATEQLKQDGLVVHMFRDPPGKAASNPLAPVAEIADARMKESITGFTASFIESVADRRPNAGGKRGVRALDGAMLRGKAAVDGGLADRVGSYEDVLKRAAEAANRRRIDMKNADKGSKALQALGLTEDATDEQIAIAGNRAQLGARVFERTGLTDVTSADARVGAWQKSHESAVTERAELAAKTTKLESDERVKLYTQQIVAGWRTPGTTWAKDANGLPLAGSLLPHLAAADIGAVREETKTLCATPRAHGGPNVQPSEKTGEHGLTDRELAECAEVGCNPAVYAKLKEQRARKP